MRSICNYLSNLDFVPTQAKTYLGITILVFKRFLLGTPPPDRKRALDFRQFFYMYKYTYIFLK